ncbi:MAG: hypothetical protein R2745_23250 [Vicinamibacterales bacterium]
MSATARHTSGAPVGMAGLTAGMVTAQFVAGKAARDALFLAHLDVSALPAVVFVTALVSMAVVAIRPTAIRRLPLAIAAPATFVVSAVLLVAAWGLIEVAPRSAAVAVYLLVSGIGPMLGSGFWLVVSEGFDPRSAKRHFGRITAAGTLGGFLGGMLAARAATLLGLGATLPMLAALNLVSAGLVFVLARGLGVDAARATPAVDATATPTSGLEVLRGAPYLRDLAALVVFGSMAATLADFVLKADAAAAFGDGDALLRFFGAFHGGVSLLTFAMQVVASRVVLERFGLAVAAGSPSAALALVGLGGVFAPGLVMAATVRGGESVLRGSLFRAGYELYYTPVPAQEKRAAKSVIDVLFDRAGEAVGAGLVRAVLLLLPVAFVGRTLLGLAVVVSVLALAAAARLNAGYVSTLERSLRHRAADLDLADVEDATTRTVMLRSQTLSALPRPAFVGPDAGRAAVPGAERRPTPTAEPMDDEDRDALALQSHDPILVRTALARRPLARAVVPRVVPLLAWDAVAKDAASALRSVANRDVGTLVHALLDPHQEFAVRRRLARVLSACESQDAADGLVRGLADPRFEVRYQCARSLRAITRRHADLRVEGAAVLDAVQREVAAGRPMWDSQRLLDETDASDDDDPLLDKVVRDRASRSLAHVFTLLSLVLPAAPLELAFRGLQTDDQKLRGTALEYLECVLPPAIRDALWPYLDDERAASAPRRTREDILEDLLQANRSITINLEAMRHRVREAPPGTSPTRRPADS